MPLVLDLNTQTKSGFRSPDGDTNETLKLTEVILGDKIIRNLLNCDYITFSADFG